MAYKVVDLFAGVGGLSYGFAHDKDFLIVAANEILEPMARAYSANHPSVKMYNKDIKDFSISDLTTDLGLKERWRAVPHPDGAPPPAGCPDRLW